MAASLVNGYLIQCTDGLGGLAFNEIAFQFNPESITHTWTQPEVSSGAQAGASGQDNPLAVRGLPGEQFTFTIPFDAAQMITGDNPAAEQNATESGVYTRLAALEMLLYPLPATGTALVGSVSVQSGSGGAKANGSVPAGDVPLVLFAWGAGRRAPVRITGLTITEKLYDAQLNPIHAEVQVTLRVLTPDDFKSTTGRLKELAVDTYNQAQSQRQRLAEANRQAQGPTAALQ